ncbi:MAG: S8 family serine peptidase [Candidatus Zixiibacteriota bacterium]
MLALLILGVLFNSPLQAGKEMAELKSEALIKPRAAEVIAPRVRQFLIEKQSETVKIWVFFTDKRVFNQAEFDRKATEIDISEKNLTRRAKVNRDRVVFADLPVVRDYINAVADLGAKHRRTSKWLNAASFEVTTDLLERIAELPFVSSIRPVVGFKQEETTTSKADIPESLDAMSPTTLNYGSSFGQLDQINVPQVHSRGYTGKGVTLAVFDTGYRKTHEAFSIAYAQGRVLAEWDFIFDDGNTANEAEDWSSQWEHGTGTWAVAGGWSDGKLYGPAYEANFILAKTEDVRSETPVEEDNWVAALEWTDSIGVDVVTSSLSYPDFYDYYQLDGLTATTTQAANTADGLGIVVCASMGNSGPASGTLGPPADAFNILAIGAVYNSGSIASFSSRGPTADGRTKPEVCAQGVDTYWASSSSDAGYGYADGTSLSCPLVAGVVCQLIEAHPTYTPEMIRTALMETASRADAPDNTYGWGIIDAEAAVNWGVNFVADTTIGDAPLTVTFTDSSTLSTPVWRWDFGDGDTSNLQNPTHYFPNPGAYDISLTIETSYGELTNVKQDFIVALADTIRGDSIEGPANVTLDIPIYAINNISLYRLQIPVEYGGPLNLKYEGYSITGLRTENFANIDYINYDGTNKRLTLNMEAGSSGELSPGSDPVIILKFKIQNPLADSVNYLTFDGYSTYEPLFYSAPITYTPKLTSGNVIYGGCCVGQTGDANCSGDDEPDISDITTLINHLYQSGPELCCLEEADANSSGGVVDISDITTLIGYLYLGTATLYPCP